MKMVVHLLLYSCLIYIQPTFADETLETILINAEVAADLHGLNTPTNKTPVSISTYDHKKLFSAKVTRLSDISTLDASVTDQYNSSGYWDIIAIRGFTLDNRFSFQREGLPINAETSIPLENKERIEILKGQASIYAGAAVPGGLINYVVKRPTAKPLRTFRTEWSKRNNQLVSLDLNNKVSDKIRMRINAAQENISTLIRNTEGDRSLLAGAFDVRVSEKSLLETEIEWSRRSQPSVPGFSLLGDKLPSVPNPSLNLNDQVWSKPVVFEGLTGSFKITQILKADWISTLTLGAQKLNTDDRLAFPYGCSNEGRFDRYCSNGSFDLYDYRSENERRETRTVKLEFKGQVTQAKFIHHMNVGGWLFNSKDRMSRQTYNFVGEGNVQGNINLPPDSSLTTEGTNRDSSNLDFFVVDRIEMKNWNLWLGARQSNITRRSQQTDESQSTKYKQNFILPWSAVSYQFPKVLSYLSYGEGIETFVTPNKAGYNNKGKYLPGVINRQWELGFKGTEKSVWSLSFFQIKRPLVTDMPPAYKIDGEARQRGLEISLEKTYHPWHFGISYMKVEIKRQHSILNRNNNGKDLVNIPDQTFRSNAGYEFSKLKGLRADLRWIYEGGRAVEADNSIMLPSWNKWDLGFSYLRKSWLTQLYLENMFAKRYWKESPTQYGHIYLFPGSQRRLTVNMQYNF